MGFPQRDGPLRRLSYISPSSWQCAADEEPADCCGSLRSGIARHRACGGLLQALLRRFRGRSSIAMSATAEAALEVGLPAGGVLHLQTADEVVFWNESLAKYSEEYALMKQNDLVTLGLLLQQQIIIYRCQMNVNGMEPELDENDVPTGRYRRVEINAEEQSSYQQTMMRASAEMRALEKQLGIDKATR